MSPDKSSCEGAWAETELSGLSVNRSCPDVMVFTAWQLCIQGNGDKTHQMNIKNDACFAPLLIPGACVTCAPQVGFVQLFLSSSVDLSVSVGAVGS